MVKVASLQTTHTTHQVTKGEILRVIHGHKTDGWWKWCGGGVEGEGGSGNIDNTSPLICKYQANKRTKNKNTLKPQKFKIIKYPRGQEFVACHIL